jgi:hypothetical protein
MAAREALRRAGILTSLGGVVGAFDLSGDEDAELLTQIRRYAAWAARVRGNWRLARNAAERQAVFADSEGLDVLRAAIAATPPCSAAGVCAKLEAALAGLEEYGDGKTGIWHLPIAALRDALAWPGWTGEA